MTFSGVGIMGIGAVTGYGWGRETMWDGLISAKPAATLHSGYGPDRDELAWVAKVPDSGGSPKDGSTLFAQAMLASAREAISDAEQRGWQAGRRVGLVQAVVFDEVQTWRDFYVARRGDVAVRDFVALMPSTRLSTLMQEHNFHGPTMTVSAMCTASNAGLLTAKSWLDQDIVDDVLFVATCLSATPEIVLHLSRLGVTVTDAEPYDGCRPFQEGGRGFITGEASVGLMLSNRPGDPYAQILGGAMTHDGYHATSIDPSLTQLRACFQDALANAGVPASAIRYFNAHGPSTQQCDRAESTLLTEFFQPETKIYSVKPLTGHCQGAASAVEVAVAALGYARGVVPAPPIVATAHPQLMDGPTPISDGLTIKSSLGLGGHNSALILAPGA